MILSAYRVFAINMPTKGYLTQESLRNPERYKFSPLSPRKRIEKNKY